MENHVISDEQITASSQESSSIRGLGRLNSLAGWTARFSNDNQWLQIDLGMRSTKVTRIATQGFGSKWVTKFEISYSNFRDARGNLKNPTLIKVRASVFNIYGGGGVGGKGEFVNNRSFAEKYHEVQILLYYMPRIFSRTGIAGYYGFFYSYLWKPNIEKAWKKTGWKKKNRQKTEKDSFPCVCPLLLLICQLSTLYSYKYMKTTGNIDLPVKDEISILQG